MELPPFVKHLFMRKREKSVEVRDRTDVALEHLDTQTQSADQFRQELAKLQASLTASRKGNGR